jgi:hypothetical protein
LGNWWFNLQNCSNLDEVVREALLFRQVAPCEQYVQPEFGAIHREFKRKGTTLYRGASAD